MEWGLIIFEYVTGFVSVGFILVLALVALVLGIKRIFYRSYEDKELDRKLGLKRDWHKIISWAIFFLILALSNNSSNSDNSIFLDAFIFAFGYYVIALLVKTSKSEDGDIKNYFELVSIVLLIYSFLLLNYANL